MKEQKLYKELHWLKSRKDYMNIFLIEKDIGMPAGTLQKFIDGARNLPEKWHDPVHDWVRQFKK